MNVKTLKLLLNRFEDNAEIFVIDKEQNYSFDIVQLRDTYYNNKQYVDMVVDMDI